MRQVNRVFLANIFLLAGFAASACAATFYVATTGDDANSGTFSQPFRTVARAQAAVRSANANMSSDLTVYLRGGVYPLSSPLTFDSSDSGTNGFNVIYRSHPGERAVLSGGQIISGWTAAGGGIFKADAGSRRFRQLYVNDRRATRARYPNEGDALFRIQSWDDANRLLVLNAAEISHWARLNEVEIVATAEWAQGNFRIGSFSVSGASAHVAPMEPERTEGIPRYVRWGVARDNKNYFFFENAYEFLDSPGEWYLNTETNELFYMPRPDEDMSSAEVIAPVIQTLVNIQGTPDAPVHHLQFYGLAFAYANWTLPSSEGLITTQAIGIACSTCRENHVTPAAVMVENAHHLRFERNIFKNLGASGLGFWSGTHDNAIVGNVFRDIAASGLSIDMMAEQNPVDPRQVSQRDAIENNYIAQIGRDYRGNVGIYAGFPASARIVHNELADMPYSGMSIGWAWNTLPTPARDNVVSANRIRHAMRLMSDGGSIYQLGLQPGSLTSENYISDNVRSPWAGYWWVGGIYFDQADDGAPGITLRNNVIESVENQPLLLGGWQHTVINTSIDGVINDKSKIFEASTRNTYVNDGSLNVAAVKANAGLEPAYQDIKAEDALARSASSTLAVNSTSAAPGTAVTVTLQGGAGGATDWLALAAVGSPNDSYVTWTYVGTGVTTRAWTVPVGAGSWEFRLFSNDGFTRTATSPTVTAAGP
jgi:hypothetical protein